jgi:4-alpha-glucanotransferase
VSNHKSRSAGILLHITSLPSAFGIGDLGPEAIKFIDFLKSCGQRYWQVLPLNPTTPSQGYSPYSSTSSTAGNEMVISPESLVKEGLIPKGTLTKSRVSVKSKVDFEEADKIRKTLLRIAYQNFRKHKRSVRHFERFCVRESHWLDDFALFTALKNLYHDVSWMSWSPAFKIRDSVALKDFTKQEKESLSYTKWIQYIFVQQWNNLKAHANKKGILLFGDLPFYVNYDSADVWSHNDIFNLTVDGKMKGVAGVPPDYFNSNGQLWGMPTFRWNILKQQKYNWWIQRIKKNIEMYDLLRLDHFRAFADYWEVPAGEQTAIHGQWKQGPRHDFLNALQKVLKSLPFVAEDLGDINQAVYDLRDEFQLPGMKVLQFAFGDNLPTSDYIPHNFESNFIAYTGTHDNNTSRGWYRKDASLLEKKNVAKYCGRDINEKNIHNELIRLAYSSVAKSVIVPMQDILGLDERARMNTPASITNNWQWRLSPNALTNKLEGKLKGLTEFYNRTP